MASKVIQQLERELNIKILPGTELMIDAGAHHFVKASAGSDRVLVPQPSDDASDPLVSPAICRCALDAERIDRPSSTIELEQILESFRHVLRHGLNLRSRFRAFVARAHDSAIN